MTATLISMNNNFINTIFSNGSLIYLKQVDMNGIGKMSNLQQLEISIHQPKHSDALKKLVKLLDLRPIGDLRALQQLVLICEGGNESWLSFKQLRQMLYGTTSLQVSFAIKSRSKILIK